VFSGMAGILIKLIKRMKKMNPATGERLLTIAKAISPSAPVSVTNLERNSKTRILSSHSRPIGNFGRQ
jgi:hypothetical protein